MKILIASHGTLAKGMKCSLELIMGKQEEVKTFCAYLDGETSIEARVKEFMENIKEGEEWVIVTDLLGGSVNNEFMKYIHRPDIHLLTGMNLALLLVLIELKDASVEVAIEEALNAAREGAVNCRKLLDAEAKNEDF